MCTRALRCCPARHRGRAGAGLQRVPVPRSQAKINVHACAAWLPRAPPRPRRRRAAPRPFASQSSNNYLLKAAAPVPCKPHQILQCQPCHAHPSWCVQSQAKALHRLLIHQEAVCRQSWLRTFVYLEGNNQALEGYVPVPCCRRPRGLLPAVKHQMLQCSSRSHQLARPRPQ